jgi:hypothetical protein
MNVVQGPDADRIAREHQPAGMWIEEGDREVAVEVRAKAVAPRLVRGEHACGIADGTVRPQRQRVKELLPVVQAAVQYEHRARVPLPGDNRLMLTLLLGRDPEMLAR